MYLYIYIYLHIYLYLIIYIYMYSWLYCMNPLKMCFLLTFVAFQPVMLVYPRVLHMMIA